MDTALTDLLEAAAIRHSHLCPRQVLGVRIGLAGLRTLGLSLPIGEKRLMVILETDGCFADGIEAATGCMVGHRTLRVEDYGKIAATFIDRNTGLSVRIAPQLDVRQKAYAFAEGEPRRYFAQLKAYQAMPDDDLLSIHEVCLRTPVEKLVSRPGVRVNCEDCGEEIINERELAIEGRKLCRSCCSSVYYWPAGKAPLAKPPADAPDAIIATTLN